MSMSVGDIFTYALSHMSEDPTDPVWTENRFNWLNTVKDHLVVLLEYRARTFDFMHSYSDSGHGTQSSLAILPFLYQSGRIMHKNSS